MTEPTDQQISTNTGPMQPTASKFHSFTLGLMLLALMICISALVLSSIAFSSFLGGGRSTLGVFQSALMCYGVGAVVYIPAGLVFLMGRFVRGNGPKKPIGFSALLISLPFWSYCAAALYAGYPYKFWIATGFVFGVFTLVWGILNICLS